MILEMWWLTTLSSKKKKKILDILRFTPPTGAVNQNEDIT